MKSVGLILKLDQINQFLIIIHFLVIKFIVAFKFHEYSIEDDAIYYFSCFLFAKEPSINTGSNIFIENDFRNWKKVNSGKECDLLNHIGKGSNSFRHKALLHKQTSEEIENNRIRLGASIDCIRWLTFQGCAYRGHDESQSSSNRGYDGASNMRVSGMVCKLCFLKILLKHI
ncbi:hypothetical protein S245_004320, partial [Arachis hypogaea]